MVRYCKTPTVLWYILGLSNRSPSRQGSNFPVTIEVKQLFESAILVLFSKSLMYFDCDRYNPLADRILQFSENNVNHQELLIKIIYSNCKLNLKCMNYLSLPILYHIHILVAWNATFKFSK